MSWSLSYPNKAALEANAPGHESPTGVATSGDDQVAAGRAAAKAIIESGAVGSAEKDFHISISGHTNPGHEPTPGWANDCITVNIVQSA